MPEPMDPQGMAPEGGDPTAQQALEVLDAAGVLQEPKKRRFRKRKLAIDHEEVVTALLQAKERAEADRAVWKENHARWLAKYLGQIEPAAEGQNIHIPVLMSHVQRLTAGMVGALFAGGRVLKARARSRARVGQESTLEEFLNYQLIHELELEKVVERLALDFFVHGKFIAKVPWVVKREGVRRVHRYQAGVDDRAVLAQLYPEQDAQIERDGEFGYKVTKPGGDEPVVEKVQVYPQKDKTEVVVTGETITWENPKVMRRRLDDLYVPNPDTLTNILESAWIIDRSWLTVDEIKRLVKNGTYDLVGAEKLREIEEWAEAQVGVGGNLPEGGGMGGSQEVSAGQQGVPIVEDQTGTRQGLAVLECYWWWDVDGDGLKERVIFWIIEKFKTLARAKYLSEVYRDQEWPYAEAGFIPTEGFYHMGVPEFAEGLQDAIVVLHNQGLEWGQITNTPVGFYRPSSGMKPEAVRYRSGELIPLDTPRDDVYFPPWPTSSGTWRFNEESLLNQYLDRGLSQGPVQFGQAPEGRASAIRTARATLALIGQSDLASDLTLKRFLQGITRIFYLVWRRDKEFMRPGREFRVVGVQDKGETPFGVIEDLESLQGDYDFELMGSNAGANRDFMRQGLMEVFGALVNPLMIQLGIVGPGNMYELAKEMLVSHERRDFHRFVTKPPMSGEPPRDPQEENSGMMQGIPAHVSPQEDPTAHLEVHLSFVMSPQFGEVPPAYVPLYKDHLQETLKAIQGKQVLQAQSGAAAGQTQSMMQGGPMQTGMQGGMTSGGAPGMATPPAPGQLGPGGQYGQGGFPTAGRSQA